MTKDQFAALHISAEPLVLFNIWDAGSALAVQSACAKALATGSLSLAGALGYEDGEKIPFADLLGGVEHIVRAVALPLTVDIEAGYASDVPTLRQNAASLFSLGVVGCNLEDQLIPDGGLRAVEEQCERIDAASSSGLFVNARTDVFLGPLMAGDDPNKPELLEASIERALAYHAAGADCFFVPGLSDTAMIATLCKALPLPVNVMRLDGMGTNAELGALGVARISHGPGPWRTAMAQLATAAESAFAN